MRVLVGAAGESMSTGILCDRTAAGQQQYSVAAAAAG